MRLGSGCGKRKAWWEPSAGAEDWLRCDGSWREWAGAHVYDLSFSLDQAQRRDLSSSLQVGSLSPRDGR